MKCTTLSGVKANYNILFIVTLVFISSLGCTSSKKPKIVHKDFSGYLNIFPDSVRKDIKFLECTTSEIENPVCLYRYKDEYTIQILKLRDMAAKSVSELLEETNEEKEPDFFGEYLDYKFNKHETLFRNLKLPDGKILVSFNGNNYLKTIKNDSTIYFSSQQYSFGITDKNTKRLFIYGRNTESDMTFNSRDVINVGFKKSNKQLYLILTFSQSPLGH